MGAHPIFIFRLLASDLFLSANADDVVNTLNAGYAAATILSPASNDKHPDQLRIAFDGDAVLFSDESERIFQEQGLAAFTENERLAADQPLSGGPFKNFLAALHRVQSHFGEESVPIRTALVTARAAPAHERVVRTFRAWNIRIDEAMFLGGREKGPFSGCVWCGYFF